MSDAAAAMATTQGLERVLNIRDSPASLNPPIALPKACRYETHQPRRRDPERRDNAQYMAGRSVSDHQKDQPCHTNQGDAYELVLFIEASVEPMNSRESAERLIKHVV